MPTTNMQASPVFPEVHPGIIGSATAETDKKPVHALMHDLLQDNEALALWLRDRLQEQVGNPADLEAVESHARIALEVIAITKAQLTANGLRHLFGLPSHEA